MMINKNSNDKFNFQAVLVAPVDLDQAVPVSVVLDFGAGRAAFQADLLQEAAGKAADSRGNLDLLDLLHLKFHSCSQ